MATPRWLDIAVENLATTDTTPPQSQIAKYYSNIIPRTPQDRSGWGSAFLSYCMDTSGLPGTHSAQSRSWLKWGDEITEPRVGCVVILRSFDTAAKGDFIVGFYVDAIDADSFKIIMLDQAGRVRYNVYMKSDVVSYRWPKEIY